MKKLYGILFTFVGLFLVGIGSFIGFENYNIIFYGEENNSLYTGVYYAASDLVSVTEEDNEKIIVQINQESYEFIFDGVYYTNEETGFYIKFIENKLTIYKDGEVVKTLYRKYKNSIHN